MEIQVVKFEEAEPDNYPMVTLYDEEGEVLDTFPTEPSLWQRLESFIAYRWGERQAVWTVRGCGDWTPHLGPVTNLTVDVWDDELYVWTATTVNPNAEGGLRIIDNQTYRITGTLGASTPVPPAVSAAYVRLRDYVYEASTSTVPVGVASHSLQLGEGYNEQVTRHPNYIARAMNYSGAGDMLRPYRRI